MKSTSLAGCILAAALNGVSAQPSPTNINPALEYYQAFLVAPDLEPADRDYLFANEWRGRELPERFGDLVARYNAQFGLVRRAARVAVPCDWGIDVSEGPATLLPHLARAKAVSLAAKLRVLWDLQHDRQADACEDLLGAFALGRNLSRDGTLISVLVQLAIEAIDCTTVAENFGRFSPEHLKRLADGLDAAPSRGTVAACVASEKTFFLDWLLLRIRELQQANPTDDAKAMAAIHEQLAGMLDLKERLAGTAADNDPNQTNWWERLARAAGGTSAGVARLVRDLGSFDENLAVILALPHGVYESRMEQFTAETLQSPNPLLPLILPPWTKCRPREFKVQVWLAMVRAATEYKLHGEAGRQSVTDPCGNGPFAFRRFVFEGVDRGFELKSAFTGSGFPEVLIFVESEGPPFRTDGPYAGQALPKAVGQK